MGDMRKTRIGVIGCGAIAVRRHLPEYAAREDAEIAAIYNRTRSKAEEVQQQYGGVICSSVEELLSMDLDAVSICDANSEHAHNTILALSAGKHVLCEKPMSLNLDECKEMIRVARECGKELMVGQIGRYTPGFLAAKKLLDEGAIGELYMVESEYAHDYSEIGGTGNPWRITPEREPIIGGGCHAVDLVRMMAGNPIEVFAYANNKCLVDWPIHDCSVAIMKLPNDVVGKVMTSTGCKRNYTMRSTLYGTKGTIIFDNTNPTISLFKAHFSEDPAFNGQAQRELEIKIPVQLNNHNFGGEVSDFCKCILEGKPVVTSGVEGASTVSVCLAIVESFKTGNKVTVDYDF